MKQICEPIGTLSLAVTMSTGLDIPDPVLVGGVVAIPVALIGMLVRGAKGMLVGLVAGGIAAGTSYAICGKASCTASGPDMMNPDITNVIQDGELSDNGDCCGLIAGKSAYTCMPSMPL